MKYYESKVYFLVQTTYSDSTVLFVYDIINRSFEYYDDGSNTNTYSMAVGKLTFKFLIFYNLILWL